MGKAQAYKPKRQRGEQRDSVRYTDGKRKRENRTMNGWVGGVCGRLKKRVGGQDKLDVTGIKPFVVRSGNCCRLYLNYHATMEIMPFDSLTRLTITPLQKTTTTLSS